MTVIYDESLPEGQYYLRMFDNNYWANSTRTGYTPPCRIRWGRPSPRTRAS